jgi:methylthioribulose-1-phosphate dehydratase
MSDVRTVVDAFNKFRDKGWAPGGHCSIAYLCHVTDNSKKIYVTPDNITDLQLNTSDIFLLRDLYGIQDIQTPINQLEKNLKISKWVPTLLEIISSSSNNPCAVQLSPVWSTLAAKYALTVWAKKGDTHPNVLKLTYWKLLEKLTGDTTTTEISIPIINYAKPEQITIEIRETLRLYPQTCAIIIRDYGILAWGKTLSDVYNRVEVIEHVCQLQIQDSILFEKINSI